MPDISGGMARYDINDPKDLQVLINSGFIWKGGPRTIQKTVDALLAGTVQRAPDKEPPEVAAFLDRALAPAVEQAAPPVTPDELEAAPPAAEEPE